MNRCQSISCPSIPTTIEIDSRDLSLISEEYVRAPKKKNEIKQKTGLWTDSFTHSMDDKKSNTNATSISSNRLYETIEENEKISVNSTEDQELGTDCIQIRGKGRRKGKRYLSILSIPRFLNRSKDWTKTTVI